MIVLIIFAAITIKSVLDHDIVEKTVSAVEKYSSEQKREIDMFNNIYNLIENTMVDIENGAVGDDKPEPPKPEITDTPPTPPEPLNPWDNDDLKEEIIGDISVPVPDDAEIIVSVDDINKGLVIKDSKDNEWVWVPVDEATYNAMFAESETPIALSGNTGVTTTKYSTSASRIGQTQTLPGSKGYREPDIATGEGYDSDANAQTAGFSNLNDMATKLVNEYSTTLKSIKKYGGFYIGRYELSNSGVKKNQSPTVLSNWYTLYKQCKGLTVDETKSVVRMIWGCQWDVTCVWLKKTGYNIKDSSSYGNYTGAKKNTGLIETYKTNNIYDMARKCL